MFFKSTLFIACLFLASCNDEEQPTPSPSLMDTWFGEVELTYAGVGFAIVEEADVELFADSIGVMTRASGPLTVNIRRDTFDFFTSAPNQLTIVQWDYSNSNPINGVYEVVQLDNTNLRLSSARQTYDGSGNYLGETRKLWVLQK